MREHAPPSKATTEGQQLSIFTFNSQVRTMKQLKDKLNALISYSTYF